MKHLFVSTTGKDENYGTSNKPLKTLLEARNRVREIISRGNTGRRKRDVQSCIPDKPNSSKHKYRKPVV